jgi:hypothetical protein
MEHRPLARDAGSWRSRSRCRARRSGWIESSSPPFPWQFFSGERGPVAYYRLVSQLEYPAEQLATEEARASQEGGR